MTDNSFYKAAHKALGKADTHVMHAEFNGLQPDRGLVEVRDMLRSAIVNAPASLSPAATPVSEAEPVAWRWRYEGEKSWSFRQTKPTDWPDVEMQPLYALAKPASSPAFCERCDGTGFAYNQMDERTEECPDCEARVTAASSPAGGDVRETLDEADPSGRIAAAIERAAQEGYRVCAETRHVTLGDKVRSAILALSQSTSAGRVGE